MKQRDPDWFGPLLVELAEAWPELHELRLGQLLLNLCTSDAELYNMEDQEILRRLREFRAKHGVRAADQPELRVETGAVRFGEDWPGVFLRGDDAFAFAVHLAAYLSGDRSALTAEVLQGYLATLRSCRLPRPAGDVGEVVRLGPARACLLTGRRPGG